jgi:hypothetical protein
MSQKNIARQLTKDNEQKISVWINNDVIKDHKQIKQKHETIYNYINEKYDNLNTKKGHIQALAKALYILNLRSTDKLYKKYMDIASTIDKEYQQIQKENKMTDKQKDNYVNMNELKTILKNIEPNKNKSLIDNKKYLSLALHVLNPPLRLDYDMIITDNKDDINKNNNYLFDNGDGIYNFIINKDKISSKLGSDIIPINKELNIIINESLDLYPRNKLFDNKREITNLLKSIDIRLNNRSLRSAYIIWFYNNNKNSIKDKEELARKMRHSINIAQTAYNKIIDDDDYDEEEDEKENIEDNKKYFNLKEYMKKWQSDNKEKTRNNSQKYYENNKEKVLRNKILNNLNKYGNTNKPSQKSIDKYNLVYNEDTNKWE